MKVLVAGATGALGKQLVPRLVANGHDVGGSTRNASQQDSRRALAARPPPADPPVPHLEHGVVGADWTEGIALRYGGFYGPGTSFSTDGEYLELIRKRKFPLVGSGAGVWSFIHIEDAADATVAAVERGRRGVYNIVDNEPAPVSEWLPAAAPALGAKPPRHVPRRPGRVLAREGPAGLVTPVRGASDEEA